MLKKVMKARDARASDEASPLLVCSFTTFLAEYSAPYNLEPALHRCLTSLEYHKMEKPTELGKRNATSLTDLLKKKGKLAVKYNHQKHSDAAQHNLTNRRIEAAVDEPEQEDSKEDDGAEDAEAPSAVDRGWPWLGAAPLHTPLLPRQRPTSGRCRRRFPAGRGWPSAAEGRARWRGGRRVQRS